MASLRRPLMGLGRRWIFQAVANRSSTLVSPIRPQFICRPQINWVSGFSTNHNLVGNQSQNIDFSNGESKRRLINRVLYRSKQRGFLELDLVLGKWVEENINAMDENGIKALIDVLDVENPDLWMWLTGQAQPPETVNMNPVFSALHSKVMNNLRHSAPETRAMPGKPWVRGWDDFKKGRDSPISGNQ